MEIKVINPNFSIVVPTKCDSKCAFCFGQEKDTVSQTKYMNSLRNTLANLPPEFTQISITGGEPLLCKYLDKILAAIDKKRYPKVVLTTSATKKVDMFSIKGLKKIDHVNISRHNVDDTKNQKVFRNKDIPTKDELRSIVTGLNVRGIDVTLNCVVKKKEATYEECYSGSSYNTT